MSSKGASAVTSKQNRQGGLVPKLRFPAFRGARVWSEKVLRDVANYTKDRAAVSSLDRQTYISTENLLQDFKGVKHANTLPELGKVSGFIPGDILVSNIRPYLKKIWCASFRGGASNDVLVIRSNKNIDQSYLRQIIQNDVFVDYVMSTAKGVKMPRGDTSSILEYPIFVPPERAEQQKIADCLSSIDALIAAEADMLDALKDHKMGLTQQLFPAPGESTPRFRFPEFQDAAGWEEKEVGDVFTVTRGNVLAMTLVEDVPTDRKPYPVYSSQTKKAGLAGYYSDFLYEDAITWTTDGANAGDVNYRPGKFYCTNVCGVLISRDGYANACVAAIINSVSKSHVSYVGNPKLMNGVMAKIVVPLPSVEEQAKIALCLSSADTLITAQGVKINILKAHKRGLMQQLFPVADEVQG